MCAVLKCPLLLVTIGAAGSSPLAAETPTETSTETPAAAVSGGLALEAQIDDAIDHGVEYLLHQVSTAGWTPTDKYRAGYLAVQLYALLKSDVSYLHSGLLAALGQLRSFRHEKVYSVAISIMAYDAVLDQMESDARSNENPARYLRVRSPFGAREIRRWMQSGVDWLVQSKVRTRGVWTYGRASRRKTPSETTYDHSNTQFAVLALGMAARRKLPMAPSLWQEVADHFVMAQQATGPRSTARPKFRAAGQKQRHGTKTERRTPEAEARGWAYRELELSSRVSFSMTSAGQSSLLLALENLGNTRNAQRNAVEKAVRDGYAWLGTYLEKKTRLRNDTYALYSLEKVGDIGNVESFGNVRWFQRGARVLLSSQGSAGQWGKEGSTPSRHKTALALLYLGRASALHREHRLLRKTGGSSKTDSFDMRYLVHFPTLGASVPVTRFFRRLRYRPSRLLKKLGEEILESYDQDYLDELVKFFGSLKSSPFSRVRKFGDEVTHRLTGLGIDDEAGLNEWCERWRRVVQAGRTKDRTDAKWLRSELSASPTHPLLFKTIWALQRVGDRQAVPALLDLMGARETQVRHLAHAAAVFLSGASLPFDPQATLSRRRKQLRAWRKWWKEQDS